MLIQTPAEENEAQAVNKDGRRVTTVKVKPKYGRHGSRHLVLVTWGIFNSGCKLVFVASVKSKLVSLFDTRYINRVYVLS